MAEWRWWFVGAKTRYNWTRSRVSRHCPSRLRTRSVKIMSYRSYSRSHWTWTNSTTRIVSWMKLYPYYTTRYVSDNAPVRMVPHWWRSSNKSLVLRPVGRRWSSSSTPYRRTTTNSPRRFERRSCRLSNSAPPRVCYGRSSFVTLPIRFVRRKRQRRVCELVWRNFGHSTALCSSHRKPYSLSLTR